MGFGGGIDSGSNTQKTERLRKSRLPIIVFSEVFRKKCNLRLAMLNIFGGCAMLGLCTKPGIGGNAQISENLDYLS